MISGALTLFSASKKLAFTGIGLLNPLVGKIRPFARTIIGKVALSALSETGCGIAGGWVGQSVGGGLLGGVGPLLLGLGTIAAAGYFLNESGSTALKVAGIGIAIHTFFTYEERVAACLSVGQWVGCAAGTIVGGYGGLKLVGSQVNLVDRVVPTDSYGVSMGKFHLIGEIFDAVIVKTAHPYFTFLNIPRHIVKTVFQLAGFNSHLVVPFLKTSLRERRLVRPLPLTLKMICNRYCVENSLEIANRAAKSFSLSQLPRFLQNGLQIFNSFTVLPQIRSGIEFLGEKSDIFATIAMRSLYEFIEIAKKMDPENLESLLSREILGTDLLSSVLDYPMKAKIEAFAEPLIQAIRQMEVQLIGCPLMDEEKIRKILPIYLKYYFIYTIVNCKNLQSQLLPTEERDFFCSVNDAFFAIYRQAGRPNPLAQGIQKTIDLAIRAFHSVEKFIEPAEDAAVLLERVNVIEDYG